MGKYFDYEPVKSPLDFSTGLSSLGDALTEIMRNRQRQRETDAKLALDKTQQDINNRKANEDTIRFRMQNDKDRREAVAAANKQMASGDVEGAKATMHGVRTYDPNTGADIGGGDVKAWQVPQEAPPTPPAPLGPEPAGVPPEVAARRRARTNTSEPEDTGFYQSKGRPMPAAEGVDPLHPEPPVFTDEGLAPPSMVRTMGMSPEVQAARYQDTKDMAAEEQAALDKKKYGEDVAQHAADQAQFEKDTQDFGQRQKEAEANRPYTITSGPNDQGVVVTGGARARNRQQSADEFLAAFDGLPLSEDEKLNIQAGYKAIMAGATDAQTAMKDYRRAHTLGVKEGFTKGQDQFKADEAMKRAKLAGSRLDPKSANFISEIHEREAAGNRQDRASVRQDIGDWERNVADLRKDAGVWKRLRMSSSNIKADNSAAQQDAILGLASVFRGGNAATKDVTQAVRSHLGGTAANAEGWLEQAATGKLGPEQQRIALDAVNVALHEHDAQIAEHADSFRQQFGPGNGYENEAAYINGHLRGILAEHGLKGPDVYPEAQSAGALGSTDRPYKHKHRPGGPLPPEGGAKKKAKQAADDEAMQ